jgi:hypothetical protein
MSSASATLSPFSAEIVFRNGDNPRSACMASFSGVQGLQGIKACLIVDSKPRPKIHHPSRYIS